MVVEAPIRIAEHKNNLPFMATSIAICYLRAYARGAKYKVFWALVMTD